MLNMLCEQWMNGYSQFLGSIKVQNVPSSEGKSEIASVYEGSVERTVALKFEVEQLELFSQM